MREVLSYSRRGSRFGAPLQRAWDEHAAAWVVPDDAVDRPGVRIADWFGREAPLVVEIGSGMGEATVEMAATDPGRGYLAVEIHTPGVANLLATVEERGLSNVRVFFGDALSLLRERVAAGTLDAVRTFFPDPSPKTRHHKRRLVNARFAALAAGRLTPGGVWRLATDWHDYAEQMRSVLDAEPALTGGVIPRWEERPVTKFERKGIEAGRSITDLCYTRR